MTKAFNLLDEPWIPVRTHAGEVRDVGLLDALLRAQEYAGLAETSPPNLIALYRLLLAITHRALTTQHGPWRDADRAHWFREGLPESVLRGYLECWRERFWLLHPEYPFMQAPILTSLPDVAAVPFHCSILSLDQFYGTEMFDHGVYQDGGRTTAPIFRGLLGYLQFVPGGFFPGKKLKTSEKAGPLTNSAAVLATGANLEQTLLLNLHPFDIRAGEDFPQWEKESPTVEQLRADPTLATGPNDRYTRLTRAIFLVSLETPQLLHCVFFAAGISLAEEASSPDPMVAYRYSEKGVPIRVSFSEGRSVWRDLPSLLPDPTGKNAMPPAVLDYARILYDKLGHWDTEISVLVAGLASNQAKLLRWRAERIELPPPLMVDSDAAITLRQQVRRAEDAYFQLRGVCTAMIASTMPDPEQKDTRSRARAIQERGPAASAFFSTTERALPQLMQTIAAGEIDAAHRDWSATLVAASEIAWEATRRSLGLSTAVLRAEARAYPKFRRLLRLLAADTASTAEEIPS